MGYRYNFKKRKLEKTGILLVSTKQDGIKIFLNNEPYENKVKKYYLIPKLISSKTNYPNEFKISLLPNEYNLKISKEGYWSWEKNFTVRPNLTTFSPNILIFKNSLPVKLADGNFKNLAMFKNNRMQNLYFLNAGDAATALNSLSLPDQKQSAQYLFKNKNRADYSFSADDRFILIKDGGDYSVIDPADDSSNANISKILNGKIKTIKWDKDESDILYAQKEGGDILYKIDLKNLKSHPIGASNCEDFISCSDDIFIIENENKQSILKILGNNKIIANVPFSDKIDFIENDSDYLMVKDSVADAEYLIDPASSDFSKIKSTLHGLKEFSWNSGKNKLLYTNGFEIWIFDTDENKNYLVARMGEPIKNAIWHKNEDYIIFSTNDVISIMESSSTGNKNYITLTPIKEIKEIIQDDTGKNLYFTGELGAQKGLFTQELY